MKLSPLRLLAVTSALLLVRASVHAQIIFTDRVSFETAFAREGPKGRVFASASDSGRRLEEVPARPVRPRPTTMRGGLGVEYGRGEFRWTETDLVLPGRGFDLRWVRTYRSRPPGPLSTPQGHGWDHSYNLYLEAEGANLVVHEGTGRADRFKPGPGGTWVRNGDFHALSQNPDGSYTATWPHGERWFFAKLDGAPAAGRVTSIVDRAGNTMGFAYDAAGRLQAITDTVGRTVTVAYTAGGNVASVSANGRTWLYGYYGAGDPDGNPGDLRSVRTPVVTGTPQGNDFPDGKTTTYTYSKHPAVPELAHNLLKVIAPSGETRVENGYALTTDRGALVFDRIRTQRLGQEGGEFQFTYVDASIRSPGGLAHLGFNVPRLLTIVNDPRGGVSHLLTDKRHLLIREDIYTGFADPALPTSLTVNRPSGALRPGDPPLFRTSYAHDSDGLLTRIVHPEGNVDEYVYESAVTPGAPRQARGFLREWKRTPGPRGADQTMIVWTWEPDGLHQYVSRATDPGSGVTEHDYDGAGNRIQTRLAEPGLVHDWTHDARGEPLTHVWPDDGTGYRRIDAFTYHGPGPMWGLLATSTRDAVMGGLNLERSYTWTVDGRLASLEDEEGNDWTLVRNQLGEVVRWLGPAVSSQGGVRYARTLWWNLDGECDRIDVENRDETGVLEGDPELTTTYEYDSLHRVTQVVREVGPATDAVAEYEYDARGRLALIRSDRAVKMTDPNAVVSRLYDERDLWFIVTRAPGTPEASTTEQDYDGNGNPVERRTGVEDGARTTTWTYDGYDRPIERTDAMGNRVVSSFDARSRLVERELFGERDDVPGSAGNESLARSAFAYDDLDRILTVSRDHEDGSGDPIGPGVSVTSLSWAGLAGPATTTDPSSNVTTYAWDRVGRLAGVVDAAGNSVALAYDGTDDLVGRVELHAHGLGGPPTPYAWSWMVDELGRVRTSLAPGGETSSFDRDSRGNVRTSTDPRGNTTHYEYDGIDRLTQVVQDLTDTGTGMGTKIGERIFTYDWDLGLRGQGLLTGVTDDGAYAAAYSYDALDRLVQTDVPDGTMSLRSWSAHDEVTSWMDANGSLVTLTHDALGRETMRTVAPGSGVSSDTSSEARRYDGAGRAVCLTDDDTTLALTYDSLGAVLHETTTIQASGGPVAETVSFTRNASGDATQVVLPGMRALNYTYDPLHRVETVSEGMSTLLSEFRVGPRGRLERREHANGTRVDWTYDAARRPTRTLTTLGMSTIADRTAAWVPGGAGPSGRANALAGGSSFTYELDSLGRLRESNETPPAGPAVTITYTLNDDGDRTSVTGGPSPGSYVQDPTLPEPADAQVHQYTETPFDVRAYDRNGNLVERDATGMTPPDLLVYDYADRLVEYTDPGGVVTRYAYDALGRRVRRVLDATGMAPLERLVFHVGGQQGEEVDGSGTTLATYVPGCSGTPRIVHYPYDQIVYYPYDLFRGGGQQGEELRGLGGPSFSQGTDWTTADFSAAGRSTRWYSGDFNDDGLVAATHPSVMPPPVEMRRGGVDHTFHPTPDGSVAGSTESMGVLEERYEYGDFGEPRLFDGAGATIAQSLVENPFLFKSEIYDEETRTYFIGTIASDVLRDPGGFEPAVGRSLQRRARGGGAPESLILIPGLEGTIDGGTASLILPVGLGVRFPVQRMGAVSVEPTDWDDHLNISRGFADLVAGTSPVVLAPSTGILLEPLPTSDDSERTFRDGMPYVLTIPRPTWGRSESVAGDELAWDLQVGF